jgi:hypothetical protein
MVINVEQISSAFRSQLPGIVLKMVESWQDPLEVEQDCKKIVQIRIDRCKSPTEKGKVRTASSDLSDIRTAVKDLKNSNPDLFNSIPNELKINNSDHGLVHIAYQYLVLTPEQKQLKIDSQKEEAIERYKMRGSSKPFDFAPWYDQTRVWINSDDPIEAGIAAMIATGRRPAEVFGLTEFKPLDDNRCWIRRLLKKETNDLFDDECYIIPVLIDSESIVSAIERIRTALRPSSWMNGEQGGENTFNNSYVYRAVLEVYNAEFRSIFNAHGFAHRKMALRSFRNLYEAVIGSLASQQFKNRVNPLVYVKTAMSHEKLENTERYELFNMESMPEELTLPPYESIGHRGKSPADSPFTDKVTISLSGLHKQLTEQAQGDSSKLLLIQTQITEMLQQGKSIEEAIATVLIKNSGEIKGTSPREEARSEIDDIVSALIQHNEEAENNGYQDFVFISFTMVQRVFGAWKNKRLADTHWKRIQKTRGDELDKLHSRLGLTKESNYSLRGDKIEKIVDSVVNKLNASV